MLADKTLDTAKCIPLMHYSFIIEKYIHFLDLGR